ncbi:MAG: class II aldolase/adducin family protein [Chloroflexota bacterium]
MDEKEAALRQEIVQIGRLMYDKDLICGIDGNVSARLDDERVLITPSGLPKGLLREDQLFIVDMAGVPVDSDVVLQQGLKPTSELPMHLEAYHQRPDVQSVVHAHPPLAVALSIAGISMSLNILPEVILMLGRIPTAPYSLPSSEENASAIRTLIREHDAIILERHGSLTVGNSPMQAFMRLESVEQNARILFMLAQLGDGNPLAAGSELSSYEVERLMEMRERMSLGKRFA